MSSDLIFPIIPREGKVPMAQDDQKVHPVLKDPKLRRLNDQEKELNAEERDAREKHAGKEKEEEKRKQRSAEANEGSLPKTAEDNEAESDTAESDNATTKQGRRLDIYV